MGEASIILRNSITTFLNGYQHYTLVAALVLLFSAFLLFSQALIASSHPFALQFMISSRLRSLFDAASIPVSSQLFALLNLKLSQTIFSAIFILPFAFSSLPLANASVILITDHSRRRNSPPPSFTSLRNLYFPLHLTHLFNSFLVLSASSAVFSILFLVFNAMYLVGLSSPNSLLVVSLACSILYFIAFAISVATCKLTSVVSVMENCSGYHAVIRACVLIRGRVMTVMIVLLPTSIALAAVEALFQYRVMTTYNLSGKITSSILSKGFTIACIHSVIIVQEYIVSCRFYMSCRTGRQEEDPDEEAVGSGYHQA